MSKMRLHASAAALAWAAFAGAPASAWEPTKPVEIVVAAGAGGASDQKVSEEQRSFYVELFRKVSQTPEYKDYMEKQALKPIFLTGEEMLNFLELDDALNKELMTEAGFVAK